MICSSEKRDGFIRRLLRDGLYSFLEEVQGLRSPAIVPGVVAGWILAFIQSFDEVTMTIFVATPGTTTLPVALYHRISQLTDPVTTSVSTVLIVGTMLFMLILDRIIGIDKVLVGKK